MSKEILIFGASGDLGSQISKVFLENNYNVLATASNLKSLTKSKKNYIKLKAKNIEWKICDLKNEKHIIKTINYIFKKKKIPDVVVNCSAVARYDGTKNINYKTLIEDFKVNAFSNIIINKQLLKKKSNKKIILVVNIGSSSSYNGYEKTISYSSSKHALLGGIRSINAEVVKKNLLNTCISMGSMKTKMGKKVKNQNYRFFIDPRKIANIIYLISELKSEAYVEEIFFKRLKF